MGDSVLLTVHADIQQDGCPGLDQVLAALPTTMNRMVLDTQHVSFMDSSGLHLLDHVVRHAAARGAHLTTRGWQPQPRHVLRLALGLSTAGEGLRAEARAALDRPPEVTRGPSGTIGDPTRRR
ncbi:STAS domain-containing protein [Streptomyces tsukubensis]|uniref:STAS domain-containing protein n=1 Tax=Streptomyces tsukubensis TaxID=83656 RepID=A0A1V4AFI5_9ACTN|nr:STAS domain-containing protein [Streptomyces tsukubensis]OON82652.1 hypothetical protein B1H18_00880 [Streptomyces tsukubensis]